MGQQKEALRATIEVGPRAALTRWGEPLAPVSGEKRAEIEKSTTSTEKGDHAL
jgi:hypothetical protein